MDQYLSENEIIWSKCFGYPLKENIGTVLCFTLSFFRLILRGAKLEECPPRDNVCQKLPWPTGSAKTLSHAPTHIYNQLCATAQPTVSFWHLTLGVLSLESKQWGVDTSWVQAYSNTCGGSLLELWTPHNYNHHYIIIITSFTHAHNLYVVLVTHLVSFYIVLY